MLFIDVLYFNLLHSLSVPILNFTAYLNLDLIRILVNHKIDKMMSALLEYEFTFKQIRHTLHHDFDQRDTVVKSLRHDYGRVSVVSGRASCDGIAFPRCNLVAMPT